MTSLKTKLVNELIKEIEIANVRDAGAGGDTDIIIVIGVIINIYICWLFGV